MNANPQRGVRVSVGEIIEGEASRRRVRSAVTALRLIIAIIKYGVCSQLNKYRTMSSTKPRRRNREKKEFIERDQENEVGVMDESTADYRNKIEEKTEDMFDPHKLQQNILKESERSYQNNFVDFGDEDIIDEPAPEKEKVEQQRNVFEEEPQKEENTAKKRKRPVRDKKKMIDSDEDIKEEQLSQVKKVQENFSELTVEEGVNMLKREDSLKREEEPEEAQQEENNRDQQIMQEMVMKKKAEAQKSAESYKFMHEILSQAGFNKAERKRAIYTPLNQGQHSFVFFKRYASGFSEYYQAIGEDHRPILFCENQRGCIGCNYYISLTKEMDKNNPSYLGKLRGNAAGSIYQLYDHGQQPSNDIDRSKFRVSMAYIEYQSNFLGMKGPRKLKAVIPRIKDVQDFDMYKLTEEESLNTFQPPTVINLRNKQPRWNERLKSYALNFGGRVKQASIKNFILMDDSYEAKDEDKAPNLIVFGKIDENTFALEFRHPLNLFQAFGIAMSQFDFKLKCE